MNNSVECALEYKTHVYCDLPKEVDRVDTCMPSIECDIVYYDVTFCHAGFMTCVY